MSHRLCSVAEVPQLECVQEVREALCQTPYHRQVPVPNSIGLMRSLLGSMRADAQWFHLRILARLHHLYRLRHADAHQTVQQTAGGITACSQPFSAARVHLHRQQAKHAHIMLLTWVTSTWPLRSALGLALLQVEARADELAFDHHHKLRHAVSVCRAGNIDTENSNGLVVTMGTCLAHEHGEHLLVLLLLQLHHLIAQSDHRHRREVAMKQDGDDGLL